MHDTVYLYSIMGFLSCCARTPSHGWTRCNACAKHWAWHWPWLWRD